MTSLTAVLLAAGGMVTLAAAAAGMLARGLREGDRDGDIVLHAATAMAPHPEGARRVVIATVRNPGPVPVLVGLSVRPARRAGALGGPLRVSVPRRTARHRLRADRHAVVGVVGAGRTARWELPLHGLPARHGVWVVAAAGQAGGRLRVLQRHAGPGLPFPDEHRVGRYPVRLRRAGGRGGPGPQQAGRDLGHG